MFSNINSVNYFFSRIYRSWLNTWIFSANRNYIAVLYFIFGWQSAMIGSTLSFAIWSELTCAAAQFLSVNSQLYNVTVTNLALIMIFFTVMTLQTRAVFALFISFYHRARSFFSFMLTAILYSKKTCRALRKNGSRGSSQMAAFVVLPNHVTACLPELSFSGKLAIGFFFFNILLTLFTGWLPAQSSLKWAFGRWPIYWVAIFTHHAALTTPFLFFILLNLIKSSITWPGFAYYVLYTIAGVIGVFFITKDILEGEDVDQLSFVSFLGALNLLNIFELGQALRYLGARVLERAPALFCTLFLCFAPLFLTSLVASILRFVVLQCLPLTTLLFARREEPVDPLLLFFYIFYVTAAAPTFFISFALFGSFMIETASPETSFLATSIDAVNALYRAVSSALSSFLDSFLVTDCCCVESTKKFNVVLSAPSSTAHYWETALSDRKSSAAAAAELVKPFEKKLESAGTKYFSESEVSRIAAWKYKDAANFSEEVDRALRSFGGEFFYPAVKNTSSSNLSYLERVHSYERELLILNNPNERARWARYLSYHLAQIRSLPSGYADEVWETYRRIGSMTRVHPEFLSALEVEAAKNVTKELGVDPQDYYNRLIIEIIYFENCVLKDPFTAQSVIRMENGKPTLHEHLDAMTLTFDTTKQFELIQKGQGRPRFYRTLLVDRLTTSGTLKLHESSQHGHLITSWHIKVAVLVILGIGLGVFICAAASSGGGEGPSQY